MSPPATKTKPTRYKSTKAILQAKNRWRRKHSQEVADIGKIPPTKNHARKASCERSLLTFLTSYFPYSTGLKPFSTAHLRVVERIERCILYGGLFANIIPRGFAKTTIGENSAIWATLYGHRKFVTIFGADATAAESSIDSIKMELGTNELLYEDFPEAIHALRALENKPQRCLSQTFEGKLTHIGWRAGEIIMPTIPGSVASGAILQCQGLTGASRGMKHKRADGTQQRPDLFLLDDPQTDESAASPAQCEKRLDIIRKSILKLGGHDHAIAGVMNATIIRRGDLAAQLSNHRKFPSWQSERVRMVVRFSDVHETLWLTDYKRLRTSYDPDALGDQQRAHRDATEFYRINREKMDAGAEVSWEHCYDPDVELSAVQHAYNCMIDDGPEVFASECQNDPLEDEVSDEEFRLEPDDVSGKLSGIDRGLLPLEATRVVAFIDPKKDILFWTACAFADGFAGSVVDYGTYPDQNRFYFESNSIREKMEKATGADAWETALYAGLDRVVNQIARREWRRVDGALLKVERILVDANWGLASDTIYEFCRGHQAGALLLPSHGKYVGATSKPLNDSHHKPGERRGPNWRIPVVTNRRAIRYVVFDTNFWKAFVVTRFRTLPGGRGSLTMFGHDPVPHRMFADHCCAEKAIAVEARGRKVIEFHQPPGRDNDYFDCLVGCHVAASIQGVALTKPETERTGGTFRFSDRTKTRKVWGVNKR